jgi:anthranilate phosphoribosyltransferase
MSENNLAKWNDLFDSLASKNNLSEEQAQFTMGEILQGRADEEEIKKFLTLLAEKGESPSEITFLVSELLKYALPITINDYAVDPVGTGGDKKNTVNISTSAAIVTTAAGARVVKHGSIAASSKSGSADVLAALGVNTDLNGAQVAKSVELLGIGFMKATTFHSALRHAAPARRALGFPTVFNILGPLANPAKPKAIALGVTSPVKLPIMAKVVADRGGHGFAFRGNDGIDELTTADTSTILQINEGIISEYLFDPSEIGIGRYELSQLVGGEPSVNAKIIREVFAGKVSGNHQAIREAILLNSAIAIAAFRADFNLGINEQIANGYVLARQALDSGKALELLDKWAALTQELASQNN